MNIEEKGLKYDDDKVRMELLPLDVLYEIAKVLTYGAKKYKPNSWQNVENGPERYKGSLLRHLKDMGKRDKESHLLNTAHMACNALFLLWFEMRKRK